ncbi:MAG: hypothetical protein MUD03_10120 [Pirellula sp.]|jgi:hypothetical protein|nr:hypothetical protein [Pirellula sp.]
MSEILFESPMVVLGFGAVFTLIAGYTWVQTGSLWARNIALVFFLLTVLLVWLGNIIQTDKERVRSMLSEAASELQNNDFEKVKQRIHPKATDVVRAASDRLQEVRFSIARISRIHEIEVNDGSPKTAQVRANVFVDVESQGFQAKTPRWVLLDLEEHDGKWKVVHFEHRNPQHEFVGGEANELPLPALGR